MKRELHADGSSHIAARVHTMQRSSTDRHARVALIAARLPAAPRRACIHRRRRLQVHSLANGPEVVKPLLETSRKGYLAAMSASSYSFVSMMQR